MSPFNFWSVFLNQLLIQSPILLVYLLGIVLALVRWSRHPRVSLVALLGLGLLLLRVLVGAAIGAQLPVWLHTLGMTAERIGLLAGVLNLAVALLGAVAWGLILAAIFGWRRQPAPPPA